MNSNRPLRSSLRVFLVISIPLFICAWILPIFGKYGDEPASVILWVFITGDYICSVGEMVAFVGMYTFLFGAFAAVVGWILQFPVCMALDHFHRGKTKVATHTA